ncbi:cell division protein ZipA [Lysobacter sp. A6]|uniref:Cell division protein ZipA n=1 Tax=Noviluteimonas lactosilytica TaxID=2888523 RepID=A0ABS8JDN7_9GAMM|nr:cell division protein ZipA [Lysobacter lactosilyticus]MCC8361726.1 cell division protein ZipA [Lysobacter lactosilyticus]
MDSTLLRIGIGIAGVLLIAAIYFFGRPRKPGQGRRVAGGTDHGRPEGERIEPTLGAQLESELAGEATEQSELDLGARNELNDVGRRGDASFEKIVTLYVAARSGEKLLGPDIVVAAEKAGLAYGHMQIFHRLVEGHPERGPVFSVANIMKPGSFDMATIQELETPAIAFFLTLPAPMTALEAWEKMLPTAQRMAELLDGMVLDESRNALGRQRIAHIRDELRAYDRQHEAPPLTKPARW